MPPKLTPNGNKAKSKTATPQPSTPQNGAVTPDAKAIPSIVGINFGNTYASIAVFTKEGLAECIANEDGERQIACAVSFSGEEVYIGNQATQQLVKNAQNTITGFRDLLGAKLSELPSSVTQNKKSAPLTAHPAPSYPDEPAYQLTVPPPTVLSPFPSQPSSQNPSTQNTPLPTRPSSPPAPTIHTPASITTLFLSSLLASAQAFLGTPITGAVLTYPAHFTATQVQALRTALEDTGVRVLQLITDVAAAAAFTFASNENTAADRTTLVVDLGASRLSLSLLALRGGLAHVLAESTTATVNAGLIDARLAQHFATDFTKKSKVALALSSSTPADQRATAKLHLALAHTKRTLSASPGAAACAVESLKDGIDYTGTVNRLRFDGLVAPVYAAVATEIKGLLSGAGVDSHDVDTIAYIGGSAALPGLDAYLQRPAGLGGVGFRDDVTLEGMGEWDPTTVLARGCAVQGALVAGVLNTEAEGAEIRAVYASIGGVVDDLEGGKSGLGAGVSATTRTIGALFPSDEEVWIPLVHKETVLPARRVVKLAVGLASEKGDVAFEVWEALEEIKVEKAAPLPKTGDEDSDEEEEEEEIKTRLVKRTALLGVVRGQAVLGKKGKNGAWSTQAEIRAAVHLDGTLRVEFKEIGSGGLTATL